MIASFVNIEPGFSSTTSNTEKEDSSSPCGYKLIGLRLPEDHLSVTWQWIDMRFRACIPFKHKIGQQYSLVLQRNDINMTVYHAV